MQRDGLTALVEGEFLASVYSYFYQSFNVKYKDLLERHILCLISLYSRYDSRTPVIYIYIFFIVSPYRSSNDEY